MKYKLKAVCICLFYGSHNKKNLVQIFYIFYIPHAHCPQRTNELAQKSS